MKLAEKLIIAFLLVAIIPINAVGYLSFSSAKEALERQAVEELTLITESKEGQIYSFIDEVAKGALDFSSDGFIRDSAETLLRFNPDDPLYAESQKLLNSYLKLHKIPTEESIHLVFVIDLNGKVIASSDEGELGKDESNDDYFIHGSEGVFVGDVQLPHHAARDVPVIAAAAPLTSKETGVPLGVIVNFYDTRLLDKMLSGEFQLERGAVSGRRGRRETLDIYVVNREALLITPSRFSKEIMKQRVGTLPVLLCAEGREMDGIYNNFIGDEVIGASMCIRSMGWTLITEIKTSEAYAPIATLRSRVTVVGMITALFVSLFAYLLARRVSRPVVALSKATRKLAKGDFSVRTQVDSKDEIEDLASSFNRMAMQLQESNQLKELFMDILSHDLLNPASVIRSYAEMQLEEAKDEEQKEAAFKIKGNAEKLIEIIENAKAYARFQGAEKVELERSDINEIFEEVVENFRPLLEEKKMKLKYLAKGERWAMVNPTIENVFSNLFSNAIKYSPEGGKIEVNILDKGDDYKIYVKDWGYGIAAADKPGLFTRFKRADKRGVKGTGLGLAIVKRIVELHGGRVWIEDNPEGGSVFYVDLPKGVKL